MHKPPPHKPDAVSSIDINVQTGLQQCVDNVPAISHNEHVAPPVLNTPSLLHHVA